MKQQLTDRLIARVLIWNFIAAVVLLPHITGPWTYWNIIVLGFQIVLAYFFWPEIPRGETLLERLVSLFLRRLER